MKPSDVVSALTALIPTNRAVFLHGPPGVGKSSVVRQVAEKLGREFADLRASQLDPVDLRGLPSVKGGKTTWCQPDFLPTTGEGILLLDELPQAEPAVRKAMFQLVLDRRLGDYQLPPRWAVVAAGNRVEDRAGAGRIETALNSRFVHLDVEVSVEDWQEWALGAGVAPEVRAFINFRPNLLFQFDPAANPRSFACPRTWHFVSDVLPATPPHLLQRVAAGCVSDGPAAEFVSFLRLYRDLPDVDGVLASPAASPVPREPSVLFALVGALSDRVRNDRKLAGNFARYAMRLPDEFGMLALKDAVALDPALVADKTVQSWITQARQKGLFVAA